MRQTILRLLYKVFPFELKGDCKDFSTRSEEIRLSCIINFYGRLDLLSGILHSLAQQDYSRESFEVILVEDQGGTDAGREMCESFSDRLQIVYRPLDKNFGKMGYSRNFGLRQARGSHVLFLDDDTTILQQDFLSILEDFFTNNPETDAIVPLGKASFGLTSKKYEFHDPYFMTSRCTAYRREVLAELGGFMSHFVGQEDVEFVTRFTIAGKRSVNAEGLIYYHPPLLVPNTRKPRAVGFSFYGLKGRYSLAIWLLLLTNCARHAPLYLLPGFRFREQGRFGWGFLLGVLDGMRGGRAQAYA